RNPVQIHRKLTNEHLFPSQSSKMRNHLAEDDAYRWDRRNPVQIHRKLTNEHLFPSQSSKMRNHLAEDDAYRWDRRNPVQIHRKLTNEHLFPSQSSKMRNHLAEDVPDKEMLNLVLNYKDTLGEKGSVLDGAVELLQKTSTMINVFRDRRPLYTESDERLKQIDYVKEWFSQWKNGSDNKSILSKECMEDVHATIEGFKQLCVSITKEYPGWSIIPAMINSDPIENIFCQQRGKFNGNNTNPTALQYKRNMNSVILGQNSISKKSNSSSSMSSTQCENYIFSMKKASLKVNSRKRKSEQSKQLKTGDCPSKAPCIRL
ncbi:MAG: hypothetical protein AB2693_24960, partial [Candidatus Thiodiazotropha sp.]